MANERSHRSCQSKFYYVEKKPDKYRLNSPKCVYVNIRPVQKTSYFISLTYVYVLNGYKIMGREIKVFETSVTSN